MTNSLSDLAASAAASSPVPVVPPPVNAPVPAAESKPVDESCIERVESLLDATELAIALVEDENRSTAQALDFKLSVLMPVFNEVDTIDEIVRRVRSMPLDLELVIVDDGSTDGTVERLERMEAEPNVRVFYHKFNHGKGAALRTGLMHVAGDIVLIQDADLEYDPADYPALLAPILEGKADVVYGSRFLGDEIRDPSFVHRLGNRVLTTAANVCNRQRLTDMETCYKVFRRHVLEDIDIEQDRFGFEPEITAKLARRRHSILEVPIRYNARSFDDGKKIGVKDALNALYCIVRYSMAD